MTEFAKGNTFGTGRPPGSRNKSTQWFDELGNEGAEQAIRTVTDKAARGNMQAATILLARTWPRRRGRPVKLELPAVETPAGLVQAQAALVAAVSRGELTPSEAAEVSALLDNQRRAIESTDHEARLQALEEARGPVKVERSAAGGRPTAHVPARFRALLRQLNR